MNPEEAVQTHLDLQARVSIGMHHDTFFLGDELPGEAASRVTIALGMRGVEKACFQLPFPGERVEIPCVTDASQQGN